MNGIVYCLSFPGGKKYVGSTTLPLPTRLHCHRQKAAASKTPLYQCWREEGEPTVSIIAVVPLDQFLQREREEVDRLGQLKLNVAPGGMNGGFPGNSNAKGSRSPATRERMGEARKGNKNRLGVLHSAEVKARISEAIKRKWAERGAGQCL